VIPINDLAGEEELDVPSEQDDLPAPAIGRPANLAHSSTSAIVRVAFNHRPAVADRGLW
jgi:hypothetical protein